MISIYSYVHDKNIDTNFVNNFCTIAKDVSLCVSNSEIYEEIILLKKSFKNLHVKLINSIDLSTGYNIALKNTNNAIKLCLSHNEYIDTKYKNIWYDLANLLLYDVVDAYAIPLFSQDMKYIMSKWFLHKENCVRGQCITELLDYVDKSDGMDLINIDTKDIVPFRAMPITIQNGEPFVIRQ